MLFQDLVKTETDFRAFETRLSAVHAYLGGIPARELGLALRSYEGLSVVYQPQINVEDGQVSAVEALVRWHHPKVGAVSPRVFIPIAEETGLILQVTDFVLTEACNVAKRHPGVSVAVNLSPLLFAHPALIERLAGRVTACGVKPQQIEFEVTEDHPLAGDGSARESVAFLRGIGFRIALDDYGVGYSSLQRLKHIGVDKLKIDQSYVRTLCASKTCASRLAIKDMIDLAREMDLIVTAEGIETEEQRRVLVSAGCDALQGYLFARPMAVQDLDAYLRARALFAVAA